MLLGISCNYLDANIKSKKYNVLQLSIGELTEAKYPDDDKVLNNISDFNIPIFIYSKLAYNISRRNLNYPIKQEMKVLEKQKYSQGIIIHLSKWYESTRDLALQDIVNKLEVLLKNYNVDIILETSYNISSLGSITDDFQYIFKRIKNDKLSICIDTSHLYLTGHPIHKPEYILEYLTELEIKVGLNKVKVVHLNDIDSMIFGKHTEHLNIGEGLLFKNENKKINMALNYIVSFCHNYNIPIIFERKNNDDEIIEKEINKIKIIQENLLFENKDRFDMLLKNSIVLYFITKIIDYNNIMNIDNTNILELKSKIYQSYKEKKYKLIKTEKGYKYNFEFEHSDLFYKIINERNYSVFDDDFLYNPKYINIKELLSVDSIDPNTVKKLIDNGIESLYQLKNESLKIRKKLLTPFQQKVITNYKFMQMIDYEIANEIIELIKKLYINNNIFFYGSYYRIKNNLEEPRLIKDIDILCVGDTSKFIQMLNSMFNLKVELYMDEEKKSFIFSNKKDSNSNYLNKINYFTIKVYTCKSDELPFMSIYLKGPVKQVKRIYSIAKAKGYKMNNKCLIKDDTKINFKTEKDISDFLNIYTKK